MCSVVQTIIRSYKVSMVQRATITLSYRCPWVTHESLHRDEGLVSDVSVLMCHELHHSCLRVQVLEDPAFSTKR